MTALAAVDRSAGAAPTRAPPAEAAADADRKGASSFSEMLQGQPASGTPTAAARPAVAEPSAAGEPAVAAEQAATAPGAAAPRAVPKPAVGRQPAVASTDLAIEPEALLPIQAERLAGLTASADKLASSEPAEAPALTAPEAFLHLLDSLKVFNDKAPAAAPAEANTTLFKAGSEAVLRAVGEALGASVAGLPVAEAANSTPAPGPALTVVAAPAFTLAAASASTAAAATAPATSLPLAMDSPDWPQQLGEQIHWRLGQGIQEARIEISPRDLGSVDVRLSMTEAGLRVHLSAEQADTRNLLQSELPRLRESLQQDETGKNHQGRSAESGSDEAAPAPSTVSSWRRRVGLLDEHA